MRFVIVTGVSGAGKTSALKMLEDAKYFCVDNLPIPLLEKFASLMPEIHGEDVQNVALGIDARSGRSLDELEIVLDRMKKAGYDFEILFLDAQDSVLVKRYKETRRSHPLAMGGRVDDGIRMEREKMRFLKERADYIIDTSNLLTRELKQEIDRIFVDNQDFCNMMISVLSFGFKYGIPADADLVFDVRFLPNPYYVDELRPLTGLDDRVFNYVMDCDIARAFADKLEDMINFLIPNYVKEGKTNLVIAIGCTGGKHRSVTLARELYSRLSGNTKSGWNTEMHRKTDWSENRKDDKGEMSFSGMVKEELSRQIGLARHCKMAELAAILCSCGKMECFSGDSKLKIQTENEAVARKCFTLLQKTFNIETKIFVRENSHLKRVKVYTIEITDPEEIQVIFQNSP